jgi:hypothetical protein
LPEVLREVLQVEVEIEIGNVAPGYVKWYVEDLFYKILRLFTSIYRGLPEPAYLVGTATPEREHEAIRRHARLVQKTGQGSSSGQPRRTFYVSCNRAPGGDIVPLALCSCDDFGSASLGIGDDPLR